MTKNSGSVARSRELQKKIFDGGFAGIRYPEEYGGQGLTREHQVAWHEATAGYQVPHGVHRHARHHRPDPAGLRHRGAEAPHLPAHAGRR